jgi:hypothetical protein
LSGFAEWSRQAGTKPFQWPEAKPATRIGVRLMPAFFGEHTVNIQPGDPHASIALNRADIRFPEPFDDDHLTQACRAFITEAVRQAVRRDQHMRLINWPDGSSTLFTRDRLMPILRPPSGNPQ